MSSPNVVTFTNSFDLSFTSFDSNSSDLFSFAHQDLRDANFTELFDSAIGNDYSNYLWDGDVVLVIKVSNITSRVDYKVSEWAGEWVSEHLVEGVSQ